MFKHPSVWPLAILPFLTIWGSVGEGALAPSSARNPSGNAAPAGRRSPDAEGAKENTPAAPPSGVILIDEEIWVRLADEPADHLQKAHAALNAGKLKEAAGEVEKASAFVFASAGHLGYRHKQALHASAEELDGLAKQLRGGKLKSNDELTDAFSRAQFALAAYNLAETDRELKSHDAPSLAKAADQEKRDEKHCSTAGLYLQAAAHHLEGSAKWRDKHVDDETAEAVKQMRKLAEKLVACDVPIADAIDRLGQIDKQVAQLRRQHEAPQAASRKKHEAR